MDTCQFSAFFKRLTRVRGNIVIRWIINHLRCFPQNKETFWVTLAYRKKGQDRRRYKTKNQNKTFNQKGKVILTRLNSLNFLFLTWWTKTSPLASSLVMKPNPLTRLNHFTEPVISLSSSIFPLSENGWAQNYFSYCS